MTTNRKRKILSRADLPKEIRKREVSSAFKLFDLPKDVRTTEIYPDNLPKELCFFAQTSKRAELETAFLRLQHAAVNAEPESYEQKDETKLAAIAILKRHPELLFKEGIVKDHFGRFIKASPYRLFLGVGDSWALKQVHDEILPLIEDGETKAREEFKKQFPYGPLPFDPKLGEEVLYDARNIEQIKQVIAQLQTIIAVVTADPCTDGQATLDVTRDAVSELCKIFAPKKGEIIETGLHFPLRILKEINKEYQAKFNPWSVERLSFFSRAVIGSAVAALTAVDGQSCKNGLNKLDMQKGPDRRDGLYCPKPMGVPKDKAPIGDKLGHEMFVNPFNGDSCFLSSISSSVLFGYNPSDLCDWYSKGGSFWHMPGVASREQPMRRGWTSYGEQKQEILRAIMQHTKGSQHIVLRTISPR